MPRPFITKATGTLWYDAGRAVGSRAGKYEAKGLPSSSQGRGKFDFRMIPVVCRWRLCNNRRENQGEARFCSAIAMTGGSFSLMGRWDSIQLEDLPGDHLPYSGDQASV